MLHTAHSALEELSGKIQGFAAVSIWERAEQGALDERRPWHNSRTELCSIRLEKKNFMTRQNQWGNALQNKSKGNRNNNQVLGTQFGVKAMMGGWCAQRILWFFSAYREPWITSVLSIQIPIIPWQTLNNWTIDEHVTDIWTQTKQELILSRYQYIS